MEEMVSLAFAKAIMEEDVNSATQLIRSSGCHMKSIKFHHDTDSQGGDMSPVCFAAAHGKATMVRLLLGFGADPNATNPIGGFSPGCTTGCVSALFVAAENGYTDVVAALISGGAMVVGVPSNVDATSPLHTAVLNGHADIVKLLVEAGADVSRRAVQKLDCHKPTSLVEVATLHRRLDILEILIDIGRADVNEPGTDDDECSTVLITAVTTTAAHEGEGKRILTREEKDEERRVINLMVNKLIAAGANVSAVHGESGGTALDFAISRGYTEVARALVAAGAKPKAGFWCNVM